MDLSNIQDWFNANKLTLNIGETVYMLFDIKNDRGRDLGSVLNEINILRVDHTRFLGLWIDDNLSWHIDIEKLLL